jgi:hypothetical protein
MTYRLNSYPKQIDNRTRDLLRETEHRDPKIPNPKDISQYQSQGTEGPRVSHSLV